MTRVNMLMNVFRNKNSLKTLTVIALVNITLFTAACSNNEIKTDAITANWQSVASQGNLAARHEAGFINVGKQLYLLGGRKIKPINVYDPSTNLWQEKAKPPIEIHHFQPVVFENKIYVIGAMTGKFPNEVPLKHILIYSPETDLWTIGDEIPLPRRRGGSGVSLFNNKMYISGGITQGHMTGTVPWFDEYDPKTGTWQILPDMPNKRDHFQSAIIQHKLYAAGGRKTSVKTKHIFDLVVNEVDIYDFTMNKWTTAVSPLPTGRAGNTTIAVDNKLWVIGGESATQKVAHNEVEIFSVLENKWLKGPSLITGRHGTGAAIVDDVLWTASGSGNRGGKPELYSLEKITVR